MSDKEETTNSDTYRISKEINFTSKNITTSHCQSFNSLVDDSNEKNIIEDIIEQTNKLNCSAANCPETIKSNLTYKENISNDENTYSDNNNSEIVDIVEDSARGTTDAKKYINSNKNELDCNNKYIKANKSKSNSAKSTDTNKNYIDEINKNNILYNNNKFRSRSTASNNSKSIIMKSEPITCDDDECIPIAHSSANKSNKAIIIINKKKNRIKSCDQNKLNDKNANNKINKLVKDKEILNDKREKSFSDHSNLKPEYSSNSLNKELSANKSLSYDNWLKEKTESLRISEKREKNERAYYSQIQQGFEVNNNIKQKIVKQWLRDKLKQERQRKVDENRAISWYMKVTQPITKRSYNEPTLNNSSFDKYRWKENIDKNWIN